MSVSYSASVLKRQSMMMLSPRQTVRLTQLLLLGSSEGFSSPSSGANKLKENKGNGQKPAVITRGAAAN